MIMPCLESLCSSHLIEAIGAPTLKLGFFQSLGCSPSSTCHTFAMNRQNIPPLNQIYINNAGLGSLLYLLHFILFVFLFIKEDSFLPEWYLARNGLGEFCLSLAWIFSRPVFAKRRDRRRRPAQPPDDGWAHHHPATSAHRLEGASSIWGQ